MIFRLGGFDYIKVAPGDVRLPVCSRLTRLVRAGYSRHHSGASRERGGRKMAASTCSVVSRPAPIPPGRL